MIRNRKIEQGRVERKIRKSLKPEKILRFPIPIDENNLQMKFNKIGTRLSVVARELNIGINTLVEYLRVQGVAIEANPNTKLSDYELGLLNGIKKNIENYFVIDYTLQLLEELKLDYNKIFSIGPEKFEKLVALLLEKCGYQVKINGQTNRKDGGIDIIAWKKDLITIIIAVQVKFKTLQSKKVTVGEVRDLQGALTLNQYFTAGMLITNTDFTDDAKWIEKQLNANLELKDSSDIQNWMRDNFTSKKKTNIKIEVCKDVELQIQIE